MKPVFPRRPGARGLVVIAVTAAVAFNVFDAWLFHLNYAATLRDAWGSASHFGGHRYGISRTAVALLLTFGWTALLIWAALRSAWRWRPAYIAGFGLCVLVSYGALTSLHALPTPSLIGVFFIYDMKTAAAVGLTQFAWTAFIPIGGFVLLLLTCRPPAKAGGALLLLLVVGSATALFSGWYFGQRDRAEHLVAVPALVALPRAVTYFFWDQALADRTPREPVVVADAPEPADNILMIVDESVRPDHLSLNGYARDTTPYLRALATEGLVHNWGTAVAGATCSDTANRLLLTGADSRGDVARNTAQWPTLMQYARAMRYETAYFDAQTNAAWTFREIDRQFVGNWRGVASLGASADIDLRVADLVASQLRGRTGQFILVNKAGAHAPYEYRYPPEASVWTPTPTRLWADTDAFRAETANAYDNAIRYSVDGFFRRLLADRTLLSTTLVVYTSDHGETLYANGERLPHCGGSRPEALVPLLVVTARPFDADVHAPASHASLFTTLLDLLGVPAAARGHNYAPSLLTLRAGDRADRWYLGGVLGSSNARPVDADAAP
jgi:glucan phosphoethanolaminetransferase (alkaline phosphatase superfamily)